MIAADRLMLDFAEAFERSFVHQGEERRDIDATLAAGLSLLRRFSLDSRQEERR